MQMSTIRLRKILTLAHLWIAGFAAPIFLIVAISGGLYLAGVKPTTTKSTLILPVGVMVDASDEDIADQIRDLLKQNNITHDFDYLKVRGKTFHTRPTSKDFIVFEQQPTGLTATLNKPSLSYALLELHKGHGPSVFRTYQMLVALALIFAVFGGICVGILAKAYRTQTLLAAGLGTLFTLALALL